MKISERIHMKVCSIRKWSIGRMYFPTPYTEVKCCPPKHKLTNQPLESLTISIPICLRGDEWDIVCRLKITKKQVSKLGDKQISVTFQSTVM